VSGRQVLFLPGASGDGRFWRPVANLLPEAWDKVLVDFPGLGEVPSDPRVQSFEELVDLVLGMIQGPVDVVAQSMGGVVAMHLALERPRMVRRLVLVATSGGVDLSRFKLEDWRLEYRAEYPNARPFVTDQRPEDLSHRLASIQSPTLLIWGAGDPISPPEVGRYVESRLTGAKARLVILDQTDHMFARDRASEVAPLILEHLETRPKSL
jgi:pimeloyl-ACP methyl ester carboxylesterase